MSTSEDPSSMDEDLPSASTPGTLVFAGTTDEDGNTPSRKGGHFPRLRSVDPSAIGEPPEEDEEIFNLHQGVGEHTVEYSSGVLLETDSSAPVLINHSMTNDPRGEEAAHPPTVTSRRAVLGPGLMSASPVKEEQAANQAQSASTPTSTSPPDIQGHIHPTSQFLAVRSKESSPTALQRCFESAKLSIGHAVRIFFTPPRSAQAAPQGAPHDLAQAPFSAKCRLVISVSDICFYAWRGSSEDRQLLCIPRASILGASISVSQTRQDVVEAVCLTTRCFQCIYIVFWNAEERTQFVDELRGRVQNLLVDEALELLEDELSAETQDSSQTPLYPATDGAPSATDPQEPQNSTEIIRTAGPGTIKRTLFSERLLRLMAARPESTAAVSLLGIHCLPLACERALSESLSYAYHVSRSMAHNVAVFTRLAVTRARQDDSTDGGGTVNTVTLSEPFYDAVYHNADPTTVPSGFSITSDGLCASGTAPIASPLPLTSPTSPGASTFSQAGPIISGSTGATATGSWFACDLVAEFERQELSQHWRISSANARFDICKTYPTKLVVPALVSEELLFKAAQNRSKSRALVVTYFHKETGAAIVRAAQPVGTDAIWRMAGVETPVSQFLAALKQATPTHRDPQIIDLRPPLNAHATFLKGGGCESGDVIFQHIGNIQDVSKAFRLLFATLHPKNPDSSPLAAHAPPSQLVVAIAQTGWIDILHSVLKAAVCTARCVTGQQPSPARSRAAASTNSSEMGFGERVRAAGKQAMKPYLGGSSPSSNASACESTSARPTGAQVAVVHCTDGWDRTAQVCCLAQLLLDPYFRTIKGFCVLVDKDFVQFGHQFRTRSAFYDPEATTQKTNNLDPGGGGGGGGNAHMMHESGPIFLMFLDCVYQLINLYPTAFEFNEEFLLLLADCFHSGAFGNFAFNNYAEMLSSRAPEKTISLWSFIERMFMFSTTADVGLCNSSMTASSVPPVEDELDSSSSKGSDQRISLPPPATNILLAQESSTSSPGSPDATQMHLSSCSQRFYNTAYNEFESGRRGPMTGEVSPVSIQLWRGFFLRYSPATRHSLVPPQPEVLMAPPSPSNAGMTHSASVSSIGGSPQRSPQFTRRNSGGPLWKGSNSSLTGLSQQVQRRSLNQSGAPLPLNLSTPTERNPTRHPLTPQQDRGRYRSTGFSTSFSKDNRRQSKYQSTGDLASMGSSNPTANTSPSSRVGPGAVESPPTYVDPSTNNRSWIQQGAQGTPNAQIPPFPHKPPSPATTPNGYTPTAASSEFADDFKNIKSPVLRGDRGGGYSDPFSAMPSSRIFSASAMAPSGPTSSVLSSREQAGMPPRAQSGDGLFGPTPVGRGAGKRGKKSKLGMLDAEWN